MIIDISIEFSLFSFLKKSLFFLTLYTITKRTGIHLIAFARKIASKIQIIIHQIQSSSKPKRIFFEIKPKFVMSEFVSSELFLTISKPKVNKSENRFEKPNENIISRLDNYSESSLLHVLEREYPKIYREEDIFPNNENKISQSQ